MFDKKFDCTGLLPAAALLVLLGASGAAAKDCGALKTQTDMNLCESENFQKADAELNEVYRQLSSKVSPAGKRKLADAQRAWIKYRDLQCDFETLGTKGGSIRAMLIGQCKTQLTVDQTKRLDHQFHCQEGDTSCGGQ